MAKIPSVYFFENNKLYVEWCYGIVHPLSIMYSTGIVHPLSIMYSTGIVLHI